MSKKLYLYHPERLHELQGSLQEYSFCSISSFIYHYESVEKLMAEGDDIDNIVVDLSSLIKDGNFFRVFTERYIMALADQGEEVHFCLMQDLFDAFNNHYPYLFDNEDIDKKFCKFEDSQIEDKYHFKPFQQVPLYIYDAQEIVNSIIHDKHITSLACLIDDWEGVILKYNLSDIIMRLMKSEIEYIDISSALRTMKLRSDLVFQFEILFQKIGESTSVKYCADSSTSENAIVLFPFVFSELCEMSMIDVANQDALDEPTKVDINTLMQQVQQQGDKICSLLKGHSDFKTDFRESLLKFSFFNVMKEQSIFSILICGESGIGKTEFAKIVSKIIYPEESLIKINFGNYSTEGVLNSLIGSPLGYVGSEEGGELINKIALSRSKVILIDEFEKATMGVYNFFYELLEDGKFTDRHGIEHDLNGYIIVFTSNMTQKQYQRQIPDSLKSRFDMVYCFIELSQEEKQSYIIDTANKLIDKLNIHFGVIVDIKTIEKELNELTKYKNLRDMKKEIEGLVFSAFIKRLDEQSNKQ